MANSGRIHLFGDVAQLVSALRSHRRGRGFESLHPHQTQRHPAGASVFGYVYGTRSGGNGAAALVPKTIPGSFTMGCPGFCIYLICSKTDRQRCSGTMKTNKNKSQ